MSVQLYSVSEPGPAGTDAAPQSTTVGGNKPLHRFIKGQPKMIGIVLLVLGAAFFLISIGRVGDHPGLSLFYVLPVALLFIVCGILYILTEHNPTKGTVTTSLALSIVNIVGSFCILLTILSNIGHNHQTYYYGHEIFNDNVTESHDEHLPSPYQLMEMSLEIIFVFYNFAGIIILIVMSTLASAALRSTKSQAIVVMTTSPTAAPSQ